MKHNEIYDTETTENRCSTCGIPAELLTDGVVVCGACITGYGDTNEFGETETFVEAL